jgi:hypothetical protein
MTCGISCLVYRRSAGTGGATPVNRPLISDLPERNLNPKDSGYSKRFLEKAPEFFRNPDINYRSKRILNAINFRI